MFYIHTQAYVNQQLLHDFLAMRSRFSRKMFSMVCEQLLKYEELGFPLQEGVPGVRLEAACRPHYSAVVILFKLIEASVLAAPPDTPLDSFGIGMASFCQTWMRGGQPVGAAQFSVMSPHFKMRFTIQDPTLLRQKVPGVTHYHLQAYGKMLAKSGEAMGQAGYTHLPGGKKAPAYVNLDALRL